MVFNLSKSVDYFLTYHLTLHVYEEYYQDVLY